MPLKFYDWASRVDHILSALLPGKIDKMNISEFVDLSIQLPIKEDDATKFVINNISSSVPMSYELSYGNVDQLTIEFGFTSICSLYKNHLESFASKHIVLDENVKRENSLNGSEILLVAECSETPRVAVFVGYRDNGNDLSHVRIYTAGHYITIRAEREPAVIFNGTTHNVREAPFEFPDFDPDFK